MSKLIRIFCLLQKLLKSIQSCVLNTLVLTCLKLIESPACGLIHLNTENDCKMKLLKYALFHKCKSEGVLKNLCQYSIFNISPIYALILGILGIVLSLYDIINIITTGCSLPCTLWRTSEKATKSWFAPQKIRDFKLIGLVLSLEYYFFLIIGIIWKNGLFFVPWMIFYSVLICMEFALFISRLYAEGLNYNKHSLILSMFVIYNWMAVFCTFQNMTGRCFL